MVKSCNQYLSNREISPYKNFASERIMANLYPKKISKFDSSPKKREKKIQFFYESEVRIRNSK